MCLAQGLGFFIYALGGFAKCFEVAQDGVLSLAVGPKRAFSRVGVFQNSLDRVEHVLQVDALRFQTGSASRSTLSFR